MAREAIQEKVGRALEINKNRLIRAWGANSYGQLSLGHKEDQLLPREVILQSLSVKHITGGGGHTLVVTEEGQLWTCGSNNKGQLGLGTKDDVSALTLVPDLKDVVMATGGWDFSLAVTASGDVFSWGSNSFMQLGDSSLPAKTTRPSKISVGNGERAVSVAAGLRHSVVMTTVGNVYCWGHGKKGQCGITEDGRPVAQIQKPTKVPLPLNCGRVVQIGAGSYHTIILTETGDMLFWGCNKYGQSTQDPAAVSQLNAPYKLRTNLFSGKVTKVKTGWTHLMVISDDHQVFSWGRADYGQLGRSLDHPSHDHIPAQIPELLSNVRLLDCGSEHTLAVTEDGRLYSWGWNEHGMCATGDEDNVNEPRPVQTVVQPVINIGCGAGHCFIITESQTQENDYG